MANHRYSGFIFFELLLTLSLLSLLFFLSFSPVNTYINHARFRFFSFHVFQSLQLARASALTLDAPVLVHIHNQELFLSNPSPSFTLSIPSRLNIQIKTRSSQLGFSAKGGVMYPGRLIIYDHDHKRQEIRMGIGFSKLRLLGTT